MWHRGRLALLALLTSVACVSRLPDQDLRIVEAAPTARLSADLLWKDYQTDPTRARRTYFRQPIVVSGLIASVGANEPGRRHVVFALAEGQGGAIRANLLDEQAGAILSAVPDNQRLSLKCFCEGPAGREVVLKSCVKP